MAKKVTRSGLEYGEKSSELNIIIKENIVSIMNAADSVKNIKTFDGTSKNANLENFLSSCEEAFVYHEDEEAKKLLLRHILKIKLEGSAFTCANRKIINDFEDLKSVLNQNFKKQSSESTLIIALSQMCQNKNEKVLDYANRVEDIVSELIRTHDATKVEDFIEQLGKIFFEKGLKPEIKEPIRGQRIKTLEKAIEAAKIEEFEVTDNRKLNSNKDIVCAKCKRLGHYANNCRFTDNNVQPVQNKMNNNTYNYQPNRFRYLNQNNNERTSRFCTYCNMSNHSTEECKIKEKNNNITCYKCKMVGHTSNNCNVKVENKKYIKKEVNNYKKNSNEQSVSEVQDWAQQ